VAEWVWLGTGDAQILAGYGVDFFQGFYFGQPDISPAWAKKKDLAAAQVKK